MVQLTLDALQQDKIRPENLMSKLTSKALILQSTAPFAGVVAVLIGLVLIIGAGAEVMS